VPVDQQQAGCAVTGAAGGERSQQDRAVAADEERPASTVQTSQHGFAGFRDKLSEGALVQQRRWSADSAPLEQLEIASISHLTRRGDVLREPDLSQRVDGVCDPAWLRHRAVGNADQFEAHVSPSRAEQTEREVTEPTLSARRPSGTR
jgi:hypothetical protein